MTRPWLDFLIAATPSLSGSPVRATIATSAPEVANRVATAKPIPLLPPVTIAARPERLIFMTSSQTRVTAAPTRERAQRGRYGRSLLLPCLDAPPTLFTESGGSMSCTKRTGSAASDRLSLCSSGDTAGPRDQVVGYGAWMFT